MRVFTDIPKFRSMFASLPYSYIYISIIYVIKSFVIIHLFGKVAALLHTGNPCLKQHILATVSFLTIWIFTFKLIL